MILFILTLLFSSTSTLHPIQQCSNSPSITFRDQNDVTRSGGPELIVFAPLQCANCYNYMKRLNDLATSRNYRISVVAPDFESNHIIQRTATAFPNLQIDRAGEGWPRLGAKSFDAIVMDSCSRVTEIFQWPDSDVTTSTVIQVALDAASTKCIGSNKCQNTMTTSKKRLNAYIKEQEVEQLRRQSLPQSGQFYQQNAPKHGHQNSRNVQPAQKNDQFYHKSGPNVQPVQQNGQFYHQNTHQSGQQNGQQNGHSQQYHNSQNYQQPQQNYQNAYQHTQNPQFYQPNYQNNFYTPPPPVTTTTEKMKTTTSDPVDYDYYPEGSDDVTSSTQSTQTQIPRPPSLTSGNGNVWPTFSPYYNQQNQWNPYQQGYLPNPKGPNPALMMDANLPCSAFTDDICHQQREQMGSLVSKCCNKGIYLTDVCVPGKCSNSTTQLCCFQKFLQAKYSCCNDPTQDEDAPKMTNKFNKCCHNFFITDDPCCPEPASKKYWSTAYEVCMPTVTVDFSPVRFEVHFTEGVRVIDLSVDKQWEFNCTYGVKQPQFAYLPSDHVVVADFIRGL